MKRPAENQPEVSTLWREAPYDWSYQQNHYVSLKQT